MRLADTRDPNSLSTKLRKKRDKFLRKIITDIYKEAGSVSIIDIGGTTNYWMRVGEQFLINHHCRIDIYNLHKSELGDVGSLGDIVTLKVGNGCDLHDVKDNAYDLSHSNSVIEHVGVWENMRSFANESQRVAKAHYLQTPYFWFPIDPHFHKMPFFHWLPRPIRRRFLGLLPLAHRGKITDLEQALFAIEGAILLEKSEIRSLFPDSSISKERFFGLTKSLIVSG
ncbi:MAG: hypothetical protein V3V15_02545 [Sphingorhabdus sp.]